MYTSADRLLDIVRVIGLIAGTVGMVFGSILLTALAVDLIRGETSAFSFNQNERGHESLFYEMCEKQSFTHDQCRFFHCGVNGCGKGDYRE